MSSESASDPNRWAPLDRDRHRVLIDQTATPIMLFAVMAQVEDLLSKEVTSVA